MSVKWGIAAAILAIGLSACADATIQKIPSRADYTTWTDEDQRKVDCMPGLRFYRTRPYVVVKKPFPVESETVLVDALTSPDGKFVRIIGVKGLSANTHQGRTRLEHWTSKMADGGVDAARIDYSTLLPAEAGGGGGASAQGASGTTLNPGALDDVAPHATQEDRPTGTATLKLSTNQKAVAQHEVSGHFDVIYLPDFSEQYVINPRANLGDLDMTLTQGPGGELLAMGQRVDNSAVTAPLVDAYTKVIASGSAALQKAIGQGAPGGPGVAQGARPTEAPLKGAVITLRVHIVSMATVGLYPILKESEMLESRHCVRKFGRCGCPDCYRGELRRSQHVVPIYPYSRVAYQVHRSVLVENLIGTSAGVPSNLFGLAQGVAGRAPPPAAPAGATLTNAQLAQIINAYVKGLPQTQCVKVRILTRSPTPPALPIQALQIQVLKEDGTPIAAGSACIGTVVSALQSRDAHAQIPELAGAQISAGS